MDIQQIISFSAQEREQLDDLIKKAGWSDSQREGQLRSIEKFAGDPDCLVCLARKSGKTVGYITCEFYRWNGLGQIHGLVVDSDYRRRGIASRLVKRAREFLTEKEARGIYVDTPADNWGGRQFYEAGGFTVAYVMPQYYDTGLDGITYIQFFNKK